MSEPPESLPPAFLVGHALYAMAAKFRRKQKSRRGFFWGVVGEFFCIGSTSAAAVCREYGYDPDTAEELPEEEEK